MKAISLRPCVITSGIFLSISQGKLHREAILLRRDVITSAGEISRIVITPRRQKPLCYALFNMQFVQMRIQINLASEIVVCGCNSILMAVAAI